MSVSVSILDSGVLEILFGAGMGCNGRTHRVHKSYIRVGTDPGM